MRSLILFGSLCAVIGLAACDQSPRISWVHPTNPDADVNADIRSCRRLAEEAMGVRPADFAGSRSSSGLASVERDSLRRESDQRVDACMSSKGYKAEVRQTAH